MLIHDLFNTLIDQSNFSTLTILSSLNKRKTNYATKYSFLTHYHIFNNSVIKNMWYICGHLKIIKHIEFADIDSVLVHCLPHGCIEIIKHLVTIGADIHTNYDLPLRWSAEINQLDVVKYLVSIGADVNASVPTNSMITGDTALMRSANKGNLEMVKYLISIGAEIRAHYGGALRLCIKGGHFDTFKLILQHSLPIDFDNCIASCVAYGRLEIATYFFNVTHHVPSHIPSGVYLTRCAKKGDIAMTKLLVDAGADVHYDYDSPLRMSARKNHIEVVKYLVSVGANVNAIYSYALTHSLKNNNLEMAEFLLSVGASVKSLNYQVMSLCLNNPQLAPYLLSADVDTNKNEI